MEPLRQDRGLFSSSFWGRAVVAVVLRRALALDAWESWVAWLLSCPNVVPDRCGGLDEVAGLLRG